MALWINIILDAISRRCGVKIVVVEERDDGSAFPFVFGPSNLLFSVLLSPENPPLFCISVMSISNW